jgi:hypothetical protein
MSRTHKRQFVRATKRAESIIGVVVAMSILSVALTGSLVLVISCVRLDAASSERTIALRAIKQEIADLQAMDRATFLATYDPTVTQGEVPFNVNGLTAVVNNRGGTLPKGTINIRQPGGELFEDAYVFAVSVKVQWRSRASSGAVANDQMSISAVLLPEESEE